MTGCMVPSSCCGGSDFCHKITPAIASTPRMEIVVMPSERKWRKFDSLCSGLLEVLSSMGRSSPGEWALKEHISVIHFAARLSLKVSYVSRNLLSAPG